MTKSIDSKTPPTHRQSAAEPQKKNIEAFKANIAIDVQQLVKIITTVIWEINHEEFDFIDQWLTE